MDAEDIHKEMLPMYGEHCLSCQVVHNWVQKFSDGRTSIKDKQQDGRLVEIATPETLQRVKDIIQAERRVTVDAVATAEAEYAGSDQASSLKGCCCCMTMPILIVPIKPQRR
jgi:transposase